MLNTFCSNTLKSISGYNCSLFEIARDFKLLKHNCKRFLIAQAQLQETSYAQAQLQKTSIKTELQRKLFEVEHLI
jgi:ABC-type dipeptide/oligopeptide/nickel transport system ATPase subunit